MRTPSGAFVIHFSSNYELIKKKFPNLPEEKKYIYQINTFFGICHESWGKPGFKFSLRGGVECYQSSTDRLTVEGLGSALQPDLLPRPRVSSSAESIPLF